MKNQKHSLLWFFVILGVVSLACGIKINMSGDPTVSPPATQIQQPVAPLPTIRPQPTISLHPQATVAIPPTPDSNVQPTVGPQPTTGLQPTVEPQPSNSEVPADFQQVVERYYQKAYLSSTEGEYISLDDYSKDYANMMYPNMQVLTDTGQVVDNFMIRAHFAWQSAVQFPEPSGCGFAFRLQRQNYYMFFVDKEFVVLAIWNQSKPDNKKFVQIGTSNGSGMTGNLAEADVVLIVNQGKAYVLINENYAGTYVLSTDSLIGSGGLSYMVVSGTNKDYGTRCKMTNVDLWKIK